MRQRTIGIVDYGVGNITSVERSLRSLGYRCKTSADTTVLSASDLIVLPGVGAFPAAMDALHRRDMAGYLQETAQSGKPIVGICLGMQLLADRSDEIRPTAGLGLIPGYVTEIGAGNRHIGWNNFESVTDDALFKPGDGRAFYFNHSYVMKTSIEYAAGIARLDRSMEPVTVAVRRGNLVGFQFHPEKSQTAGLQLLAGVLDGLCHAS